jgi:RNA polymerase sigma-70 factor (ECF subfamily)
VELLDAWQAGDAEAGNELVQRHFRSLHRFFRGRVDDVEDMLQRTFLGAIAARGRIRPDVGFRAFLFGVARRQLLLSHRERKKAERGFSFERDSASATGLIALKQEQRLLVRALRRLPLDAQLVVELHYWEELSIAEIAAVLEVAEGTVKSRLSRARESVRKLVVEIEASEDLATRTLDDFDRWARSLRNALDEDPSS